MDREQTWQVIEAERTRLADLLADLQPGQWETASLCGGWRVKDVAAHLLLATQPPPLREMVAAFAAARGRFHTLNHDVSVRFADRPELDIVAGLRANAGSRKLPAMTNYKNTLFDVLVHSQDIAIPLGIALPMPREAAVVAAQRVWTMGWPFWARRRLKGVRLVATDADWSAGSGEVVEGPIEVLLLLMTGRTAAASRLSGAGADVLRRHATA